METFTAHKEITQVGIQNNKSFVIFCYRMGIFSIAGLLFFFPFHGLMIVQDILFGIALLAFIIIKIVERDQGHSKFTFIHKPLDLLIIFSFIWGLVALTNAIDPRYSFSDLIQKMGKQYVLYFLAFFFMIGMPQKDGYLKWLLFPIALSTIIMSLYGCYQFYENPVLIANRIKGFTGAFYRISVLLVFGIPVLMVLMRHFQGFWRWFFIVSFPLVIGALFFTFTRGAWIAVAAEIFILVMMTMRKYRKRLLAGIVMSAIAIILLADQSVIPKQLVFHGRNSEGARVVALQKSLEIIKHHPMMGIGFGKKTFSIYYPDLYPKHSHNLFVNIAVEMGLPGLMIFIAMMVVVIRTFFMTIREEKNAANQFFFIGIFISIIGFLSLNMFDYMYSGWPGQMFWILIGLGYALKKNSKRSLQNI